MPDILSFDEDGPRVCFVEPREQGEDGGFPDPEGPTSAVRERVGTLKDTPRKTARPGTYPNLTESNRTAGISVSEGDGGRWMVSLSSVSIGAASTSFIRSTAARPRWRSVKEVKIMTSGPTR